MKHQSFFAHSFCLIARSLTLAMVLEIQPQLCSADTIDFEDYQTGGNIVTDQYGSLGVIFAGAATLSSADNSLNSSAFPPRSGNTVLYDYQVPGAGITATAVGNFWTQVGGYITGNTKITLEAYDSANNLLGSVSTLGRNIDFMGAGDPIPLPPYDLPNTYLSISAPGIAYVRFHDGGNSFTLDDFTFAPNGDAIPQIVASVPETGSTLLLCLLALSALFGVNRVWFARSVRF
jgi:hypothetical protein